MSSRDDPTKAESVLVYKIINDIKSPAAEESDELIESAAVPSYVLPTSMALAYGQRYQNSEMT